MKHIKQILIAISVVALLTACSGGGGDATAPSETTTDGTPGGTTGDTTITLVTTTCTPAPELPSPYSRVFKGCNSAGEAQYYALDECVRDNSTGLIWQGQTPAGTGLRANDRMFSNYDSTTGNQNYNGGSHIPATQSQIDASTNSIGFKNAVNASNLCGSSAWRMPTTAELQGLIKTTETPMIDNAWFPNTVTSPSNSWYRSSTPYPGTSYSTQCINYVNNNNSGCLRSEVIGLIRLVR